MTDDAQCVECGAPLSPHAHRYRGAKRCRRHALALHPFTREKAQAAARALWDRRRADVAELERLRQALLAHGGSDGD